MNKLIWKSESEMQEELKKRIAMRTKISSRDGYVVAAEGKFVYRGIAYIIKVLRYFNHTNAFSKLSSSRASEYHAVVEFPEETNALVKAIPEGYASEFLYHDTLHDWNDDQNVVEQIDECTVLAEKDIDSLLDGKIAKELGEKISKLTKVKDKLEALALKKKELDAKAKASD